jgi:dTDP-4-dehydrorhamnose 3,5-epimerase
MKLLPTKLVGVYVAETQFATDHRGSFARYFCERELAPAMRERRIVQINLSHTNCAGAVRGMHFQHPPHAEMKLIRCLKGRVWDVALDLRSGSPTFLQWHAEELTPESARMFVIPEGCAHGFQALEPDSELLYLHTAFYKPESEGGVAHNDPRAGISWPLPVTQMSERDRRYALLTSDFAGLPV